jgi:hypothetical protein
MMRRRQPGAPATEDGADGDFDSSSWTPAVRSVTRAEKVALVLGSFGGELDGDGVARRWREAWPLAARHHQLAALALRRVTPDEGWRRLRTALVGCGRLYLARWS